MKDRFPKLHLHYSIILLCLIFTLLYSCKKLRGDPDYVGTWQFSEQVNEDGLVLNTVRTITLTKDTYEETYQVERESTGLISEIIGMKGELNATHSGLVFKLKQLGTCLRDASEVCTESVSWHGEGSVYWNMNIRYFELVVPGDYEIDESALWLTRDLNTDGDILDAGEDIIFIKI